MGWAKKIWSVAQRSTNANDARQKPTYQSPSLQKRTIFLSRTLEDLTSSSQTSRQPSPSQNIPCNTFLNQLSTPSLAPSPPVSPNPSRTSLDSLALNKTEGSLASDSINSTAGEKKFYKSISTIRKKIFGETIKKPSKQSEEFRQKIVEQYQQLEDALKAIEKPWKQSKESLKEIKKFWEQLGKSLQIEEEFLGGLNNHAQIINNLGTQLKTSTQTTEALLKEALKALNNFIQRYEDLDKAIKNSLQNHSGHKITKNEIRRKENQAKEALKYLNIKINEVTQSIENLKEKPSYILNSINNIRKKIIKIIKNTKYTQINQEQVNEIIGGIGKIICRENGSIENIKAIKSILENSPKGDFVLTAQILDDKNIYFRWKKNKRYISQNSTGKREDEILQAKIEVEELSKKLDIGTQISPLGCHSISGENAEDILTKIEKEIEKYKVKEDLEKCKAVQNSTNHAEDSSPLELTKKPEDKDWINDDDWLWISKIYRQ